jgi:hypothetical protein
MLQGACPVARAVDAMRRRQFLHSLAGLGAAGALGLPLLWSRRAQAFGVAPPGDAKAMLPPELRAQSILEIFLYGGVSQYESFYCVPEHGKQDQTHFWLYQGTGDLDAQAALCGANGQPLTAFHAQDADGQDVHLGPHTLPLRLRPDLMARLRVAVTQHDLEPHEAAIPQMLGGRPLGSPALAGLGAHIQRYFSEQEGIPGRAPYSYVLLQNSLSGIPTDNLRAVTAVGLHPGSARPLSIEVDAATALTAQLARPAVGAHRKAYDALLADYLARYQARLSWAKNGAPVRAQRLTELASSQAAVAAAEGVAGVLDSSLFQPVPGQACGDQLATDPIAMNLHLAAHLLTHPVAPARYVCVIDGGLLPADGGGGYDTHDELPHTQARNLQHTLGRLAAVINQPGEQDPHKLDLDKTLVVLTTEFGRTPFQQGKKGRNHWPYGFPTVFLGGPVHKPGVFGACLPTGKASLASSPQENRIAALLALGIWPFANESFNVADVAGVGSEPAAAVAVQQRQLGLDVAG